MTDSHSKGRPSALPPMSQLAEQLRDGQSLGALAARHGIRPGTLRLRLNRAGWSVDGTPRTHTTASLSVTPAPPDWSDALCRQTDPEMFYGAPGDIYVVRRAKSVCRECPLQTACLDYALATREEWGVWGGLTSRERLRMRRAS